MLNSVELVDKNIILLHLGHMICILIYNLANMLPEHRINDIHSVAFNS